MVQPINQGILNQISNPGAQAFSQLANTIQRGTQNRERGKLMQLQALTQFAPAAHGVVEQALSTNDLAQRDQIMNQNRKLFEGIGVQFDDQPGTFDDNSLMTLRKGLQAYVPQQQRGKLVAATDPQGNSVFVRDAPGGLQQVDGFSPPVKSPLVQVGGQTLTPEQQIELASKKARSIKTAEGEGSRFNKLFDELRTKSSAAQETEGKIRLQMAIPVETSPGTDAMDLMKRGLIIMADSVGQKERLGGIIENVSDVAGFKSIQEALVGARLRAEPGVKTDADANRMRATLANINNPLEANRFISNMILADTIRAQREEQFALDLDSKGEKSANKIRSKWNKYVRETPQFGVNKKTGRPVFLHEFEDLMKQANPNATPGEILGLWRDKYGN